MKQDLVNYVTYKTPERFLRAVVEELEAAYLLAHKHSEQFAEKSRRRVLGQLRHYRQNDALIEAAKDMGQHAVARSTSPAGEHYSFVAADDIRYGRISVPFKNKIPRAAKHRKAIAALNTRLEPVNDDLFSKAAYVPSDGLGCLLITINPDVSENQSIPADIVLGVPYSNLKGWHLFESVSQILASYHPVQEIQVPDLAWTKLKKQLGDGET